uniref:helix-turn-helix domain-containing protein n=1 Tax=uncultured Erythrobacter sp. TaxID=263913 RepID=UPI00260E54E7|nr:helix-turn-helix domain-containing protein [uncultured Erythrobacter sp.]
MKRINPRLAKLHRSYSVSELADVLGVHKHTVRGWLKKGLLPIDGAKPTLILGSEFQAWWAKQRKAAKRPCAPGQMYCLRCRLPKAPALGMLEYAATNAATGNLKAMCETCGTMMHRRTQMADIPFVMPGLRVERTLAPSSIVERTHPSPNCDEKKDC